MEHQQSEQILELLIEQNQNVDRQTATQPASMVGVYRGMVSDVALDSGMIRVVIPTVFGMEPVTARSVVPLSKERIGGEVVIAFEAGDPQSPYIIGALWNPDLPPVVTQPSVEAKVDGEQVVIEGKREIVLKCGEASITLTRAGKILLRGKYLMSRSSGVNRIKGGSVQIN